MVIGQKPDDWAGKDNLKVLGFNSDKAWDYENAFNLTCNYSRLSKLISHWELFKTIKDIPGDIVELGVYKMSSFLRWCSFREINENQYARKIIGFDVFGPFPKVGSDNDIAFADDHDSQGFLSFDDALKVIEYKKFHNLELIPGDVQVTLPEYISNNPHLKLSLCHLDLDVYQPTKIALELLWNRISIGGILILDDYASVEGANNAIDEFMRDISPQNELKKTVFHPSPSFIIKKE